MLITGAVCSVTEKPQSHLSLVGKRESAPDNDIARQLRSITPGM